jgi:hypothetical protein
LTITGEAILSSKKQAAFKNRAIPALPGQSDSVDWVGHKRSVPHQYLTGRKVAVFLVYAANQETTRVSNFDHTAAANERMTVLGLVGTSAK